MSAASATPRGIRSPGSATSCTSTRPKSEIRARSASHGQVAIIDDNPRRDAAHKQELLTETQAQRAVGYVYPALGRYREHSTVERVNGRFKDEFGDRHVRVRGHAKALCHLMFGILALTVDRMLRLLN